MNKYGALDLLQKLNIDTLEFKKVYNKLNFSKDILVDVHGDFYYCEDKADYEKQYQDYSWHVTGIYYFYDSDVDAIIFEYTSVDTTDLGSDHYDLTFAIVPKSFLEACKIKLIFY